MKKVPTNKNSPFLKDFLFNGQMLICEKGSFEGWSKSFPFQSVLKFPSLSQLLEKAEASPPTTCRDCGNYFYF